MDIKKLLSEMSLKEKAALCSGKDFWHLEGVKRLDVPSIMVSDGPHGLRKQRQSADCLGINDSIQAVCFPTGSAVAASFDQDLIYQMGEVIGNECQAEDVSVILGPAVNIKRSPLCGRNFEYYSEDPYLAGRMAVSFIRGVQSRHVGTSMKHFFANSQEQRRMTSDSVIDQRTAREIYLYAFEQAVKEAQPWTVMCSYNKINGTYAAENKKYLTEVLRQEWGFEGMIVSDWGAVNDRVPDLLAGLDLEMPGPAPMNDQKIIDAVNDGTLSMEVLDQAVERILHLTQKAVEGHDSKAVFDHAKDHETARKIASECAVLLKNNGILPLKKDVKTVFIGQFASKPRYQGSGSSHINAWKVESAYELADQDYVRYAQGYAVDTDIIDETLIKEAVQAAQIAEVAVIFAGLPDTFESEGFDRTHMRLPECQNALIEAVAKVNSNVVVILHNGSPVEMPWINDVKAVLEMYLAGQGVGGATLDLLYGKVNPSGRLAETFPKKLSDNPSYLYYGGEGDQTEYREGVFVGYRYYDKKQMDVLFPFGHGLSYTTFQYQNLKLDKMSMKDTETVKVSVDVTNTGDCFGKETVQLYVGGSSEAIIRPVRELKKFKKIGLDPGETKTVTFELSFRDFAYFDIAMDQFHVLTDTYEIAAGASSRDLRLSVKLQVMATTVKPVPVTMNTTMRDVLTIPGAKELLKPYLDEYIRVNAGESNELGEGMAKMMESMLYDSTLRGMIGFAGPEGYETAMAVYHRLQELEEQAIHPKMNKEA